MIAAASTNVADSQVEEAASQFSVATNEYIGQGKERAEYHNIVTCDCCELRGTRSGGALSRPCVHRLLRTVALQPFPCGTI